MSLFAGIVDKPVEGELPGAAHIHDNEYGHIHEGQLTSQLKACAMDSEKCDSHREYQRNREDAEKTARDEEYGAEEFRKYGEHQGGLAANPERVRISGDKIRVIEHFRKAMI